MARVQDLHDIAADARSADKSYDSAFATRMHGSGLWADLLRQRFAVACRRLGFNRVPVDLDFGQFRPALARGQGCLF